MKLYRPSYYDRFTCDAGACSDTCCACWEIVVDEDTLRRYQALKGPNGDLLRQYLRRDEEGDAYLSLRGGVCPLLRDDGLCTLQKEYGEQALSQVCRRYPRFRYAFGAHIEEGLSLSCPAACRLILDTPFARTETVSDAPPVPNDIDPARFYAFLRGRETAFSIAADTDYPVFARMALLLAFSEALERQTDDPAPVCAAWEKPARDARLAEIAPRRRGDFSRLAAVFAAMEPLTPWYPAALAAMTAPAPIPDTVQAQRLLEYYLHKYFLQAAYDGKLLRKMQFAAASLLLTGALLAAFPPACGEDTVDLIHRFARETEHAEPNLARFARFAGPRRQKLFFALLLKP